MGRLERGHKRDACATGESANGDADDFFGFDLEVESFGAVVLGDFGAFVIDTDDPAAQSGGGGFLFGETAVFPVGHGLRWAGNGASGGGRGCAGGKGCAKKA